jgi:hypothetical protein
LESLQRIALICAQKEAFIPKVVQINIETGQIRRISTFYLRHIVGNRGSISKPKKMKKLVLILIAVLMMLHLSFGANEKKPKHIKSKYKIELGLKPRGQKYWC